MTTLVSANTDLTRAEFTRRVLAFLRPVSRRYNALEDGRKRLANVLADVQRYARYNEEDGISPVFGQTAYAIEWSVQSLRLNQAPEQALRAMKVREIVALIYDLRKACPTQIEVTYRLNEQFAQA